MNSRERVAKAIEFEGPDRIPITHGIYDATKRKYGESLTSVLERYPDDFADVSIESPMTERGVPFQDKWGIVWETTYDGIPGQPIVHPLADWDTLDTYVFPDPQDNPTFGSSFAQVEEYIHRQGHDRYICVDYICVFEQMQWLRGFSNLMRDLVLGEKKLQLLLKHILRYNTERIKRWNETEVDGILIGDDWGSQRGMIIDPKLWQRLFKPVYRDMFDLAHRAGKFVHFHSDGLITPIISDLVECGVDVLFIQMTLLGIGELGKGYGGKVCFQSDLDRQNILPFGSVTDVKQHVKKVIDSFASSLGGLIGYGEVAPDVPLQNIKAMYEAFEEYSPSAL